MLTFEDRLTAAMDDPAHLAAMRQGVAAFARLREALPLTPLGYSRTLLALGDGFELVAMRWSPGSSSAVHDHGDSRCWAAMLEGELEVENYNRVDAGEGFARLYLAETLVTRTGDLDHRLNRRELHRVRNLGTQDAYSINLYSAPIREYTVIEDTTYRCHRVTADHDAVIRLD
jgi:predicted metal-dependent enzyme (double-stranded beta helix superfamily)